MKYLTLKSLPEIIFKTAGITTAILFIGITIIRSEKRDFEVFYYSAQTALHGGMIYDTYGPYNLPYWYFPWLSWFYIPLALFPAGTAYTIYITISLLCAIASFYFLCEKMSPQTNLSQRTFALCMSLLLCWLLFRVGQMDFLLLALAGLTIYLIDTQKSHLAGLAVPIFLFKPHLFLIFFPYATLKGGKKFLASATSVTTLLASISFVFIADWPSQMVRLLSISGQRTDNNWNFTTLPTLLGLQENWSGTANLPFTLALMVMGFVALWRVRSLNTFPMLSLALTGSLICAPRAYAYNFPLLIPVMIWLSANLSRYTFLLFWATAGLLPFFFRFSSGMYIIALAVFIWGYIKALGSKDRIDRDESRDA